MSERLRSGYGDDLNRKPLGVLGGGDLVSAPEDLIHRDPLKPSEIRGEAQRVRRSARATLPVNLNEFQERVRHSQRQGSVIIESLGVLGGADLVSTPEDLIHHEPHGPQKSQSE